MKKGLISYIKSPKYDEFYTPDYAIKPLLKYLPKNITIWECTDFGNSNITKILKENNYNVISTKKQDFDFLLEKADFEFDMIITNPPYSLKNEFIKKCYEYNKPFCLLLPITALEGVTRGKMFREKGISCLVFDKRVNYIKNKSAWFNSSWFCFKVLKKELIFEEILGDRENEET